MNIYLVDDRHMAESIAQLLRLNAECARLQWSKTITDIPKRVTESLETIMEYVEKAVRSNCTEFFSELTDEEEDMITSIIKRYPNLRKTLGTGVVLKGEQQMELQALIKSEGILDKINDALAKGKHIIFF